MRILSTRHHHQTDGQQTKMRSALVYLLAFNLLALCARTSPIPPRSRFSSPQDRVPRSDQSTPLSPSLHKRAPGGAVELIEDAERTIASATSTTVKTGEEWKKPVILTSAGIGVVMTVGWNYIAFQSFFSNRAKYLKEKKRQEAEELKPPPKVGDTMCMVETYATQDQVEERRPGVTRAPCYKLGDAPVETSSMAVGAAPGTSPAIVGQSQPIVPNPDLRASAVSTVSTSEAPASQPDGAVATSSAFQTSAYGASSSDTALAPEGRLKRRGEPSPSTVSEISEIVEEALPNLYHVSPSSSSASSPGEMVDHKWIPLSQPKHPLSRELRYLEEEQRRRLIPSTSSSSPPPPPPMLSSATRQRGVGRGKVPGVPALRPLSPPAAAERMQPTQRAPFEVSSPSSEEEEEKAEEAPKRGSGRKGILVPFKALKKVKDLKTEDITFGLTILNTIGGIPSLILTTINAYYYRGNPKVD